MDTYYASPERSTGEGLNAEINQASNNPIIEMILKTVGGLLAVLNGNRQILAVNNAFLQMLGIEGHEDLLGLRPGEAINCIHSHKGPAGCGTTEFCSTCGAAISMVTSLGLNEPVERRCSITAVKNGNEFDIYLKVRSSPVEINGTRFLLLFFQDISKQQELISLERVFYHDIGNILNSLTGACQVIDISDESQFREMAEIINRLSFQISNEIALQRELSLSSIGDYHALYEQISTGRVMKEINDIFLSHPVSSGKTLELLEHNTERFFVTDMTLLMKILVNMLVNAFEGTEKNGTVKFWVEDSGKSITFCSLNREYIPDDIARRVFQKNFSTKEGEGRGLGTYSMKLFGEKFLGGKVELESSKDGGTVFKFFLPV